MDKAKKKSTVLHRRHKLYELGYKIFIGQTLEIEEREFVGRALCMIGEGADPGKELLVKPGKGEKISKQAISIEKRNRMLVAAIKELRWPRKEGFEGMTLEAAIAYVASDNGESLEGEGPFSITEDNLRKIWKKYKDYEGFEETFPVLRNE